MGVFGDLSPRRLDPIRESRRLAEQELTKQAPAFLPPDISVALNFPSYAVVVATITDVQFPAADVTGDAVRTKINFHVDEYLRRKPGVADFTMESVWVPASAREDSDSPGVLISLNNRNTILDTVEPRVGDRYILGYLPPWNIKKVSVPSVIALQDPHQTQLIGDMQSFLTLESIADNSHSVTPYLEALNSPLPWVRDIAVHRLVGSEICNASTDCAKKFSGAVKRQLESANPNERREAVEWLIWADSVSRSESTWKRWSDGLPILPDSALHEFFSIAMRDRNVAIGDEAFQYAEMSKFLRIGKPGECVVVVPPLRITKQVLDGAPGRSLLPVGFPMDSMSSCIPATKPNPR